MIHPFFALGSFDDEREAARAVDTAAQRLRGDDAHGGRAAGPKKTWLRLNFPTKREAARAKALGIPAARHISWVVVYANVETQCICHHHGLPCADIG